MEGYCCGRRNTNNFVCQPTTNTTQQLMAANQYPYNGSAKMIHSYPIQQTAVVALLLLLRMPSCTLLESTRYVDHPHRKRQTLSYRNAPTELLPPGAHDIPRKQDQEALPSLLCTSIIRVALGRLLRGRAISGKNSRVYVLSHKPSAYSYCRCTAVLCTCFLSVRKGQVEHER